MFYGEKPFPGVFQKTFDGFSQYEEPFRVFKNNFGGSKYVLCEKPLRVLENLYF
jgi:hypothetical protein